MPAGDPFDTKGFAAGDSFVASPLASGSSTAAGRSREIKGCSMQVADITARNAIEGDALARDHPDQLRQEGMLCYVADRGDGSPATYQLQGGIANANWVELLGIGAGGGAVVSKGEITVRNETGGALPLGTLVAIDQSAVGAAIEVVPADGSDIDDPTDVANVVAVVTEPGGIADASTGLAALWGLVSVLYKGGLTPANITRGQDVNLSEVAGRATTPADADANVPSGGSIHKIGTVVNRLTYDGAGDDLVQIIFQPGQRREQV